VSQLLINQGTKKAIDLFLKQPTHGLMLIGPQGSGKLTVARYVAQQVLGLPSEAKLAAYPYLWHLTKPAKKTEIPIEAVRTLIKATVLKTPGRPGIRRVAIVEDAQFLSLPAQNALLKTLEEPPEDMLFILTVDSAANILPTVASRALPVSIGSVSLAESLKHFSHPEQDVEVAWRLSQGRPGLMYALLEAGQEHPLKQSIELAKQMVGKTPYEKLALIESQGESNTAGLFEGLERVLGALHRIAVEKGQNGRAKQILSDRRLVEKLKAAKAVNASQKLSILELSLSLQN